MVDSERQRNGRRSVRPAIGIGAFLLLFLLSPSSTESFVPVCDGSNLPHFHVSCLYAESVSEASKITKSSANDEEEPPRSSRKQFKYKKPNRNKRNYYLREKLEKLKMEPNKGFELAEQRLLQALSDPEERDILSTTTFNVVLRGWATASKKGIVQGAPQRAEELLMRMYEESEALSMPRIKPALFSYNAVLEAWASAKRVNKGRKAEGAMAIFHLMEEHGLKPNSFSYNVILSTLTDSVAKAESWVEQMKANEIVPDRMTYHTLIDVYGKHGEATKAEELVQSLLQRYDESKEEEFKPTYVWFNCIINALARARSKRGEEETAIGERVDFWLDRMKEMSRQGYERMKPVKMTYGQAMNAHASVGNSERVLELLNELERKYEKSGDKALKPDTVTYTIGIKGAKDPKEAMRIFHRMQELTAAGVPDVAPNLYTYNSLIETFIKLKTREGLMRATDILESMPIYPHSVAYADLIYGWSQSGLREAGVQAEQLLKALEQLPPSRLKDLQFHKLYGATINAYGTNGDYRTSPDRAEDLLSQLETTFLNTGDQRWCPNIHSYRFVARVYAKCAISDAVHRCRDLLDRMNQMSQVPTVDMDPADLSLYNIILDALAKSCQSEAVDEAEKILIEMESLGLRPNIVSYACITACYTKANHPDATERSEEILNMVEKRYEEERDEAIRPTFVFYSAILQAWAKTASVEGVDKAEGLLRRNERLYEEDEVKYAHMKPHAILYNAVIDALARSGRRDSGNRANELLTEMEERYHEGELDMKPTRRSLNAVMLAYRHDVEEGGTKAEYILKRMEELSEAGVYDVAPDLVSFNTALSALVASDDADAAERAQAILDRIETDFAAGKTTVRPDGFTFSAVIRLWLERRDERGSMMAHATVERFLNMIENRPRFSRSNNAFEVWKVLHEYNTDDINVWVKDLTDVFGIQAEQ